MRPDRIYINGGTGEDEFTSRNPFCRKYTRCLNQAARLDLAQVDCRRCFFRRDHAGIDETKVYLASYLALLKTIVKGNTWMERKLMDGL
jgi:hypothetical protein